MYTVKNNTVYSRVDYIFVLKIIWYVGIDNTIWHTNDKRLDRFIILILYFHLVSVYVFTFISANQCDVVDYSERVV